mmetsp:Transcript_5246/g.11788  ORF Transcript_5246/g.11788 Transcript_5246/m.11788 type:complete len:200 (-) Transcript_5246:2889-3488(-)
MVSHELAHMLAPPLELSGLSVAGCKQRGDATDNHGIDDHAAHEADCVVADFAVGLWGEVLARNGAERKIKGSSPARKERVPPTDAVALDAVLRPSPPVQIDLAARVVVMAHHVVTARQKMDEEEKLVDESEHLLHSRIDEASHHLLHTPLGIHHDVFGIVIGRGLDHHHYERRQLHRKKPLEPRVAWPMAVEYPNTGQR